MPDKICNEIHNRLEDHRRYPAEGLTRSLSERQATDDILREGGRSELVGSVTCHGTSAGEKLIKKLLRENEGDYAKVHKILCPNHGSGTAKGTYDLKSYEGGLKYSDHFRGKMARWTVEELQIKSLVELGCGPGYFLECYEGWVKFWNMPFMGFDGCDVPDEALRIGRYNFKCLDLSSPALHIRSQLIPEFRSKVDCLVSLEMLEHWPPELEHRFFGLITQLEPVWVILSVARPGQKPMPGESHPNCQEVDEVIRKMSSIGYEVDLDKSDELRRIMMAPSKLLIDRPWADFYQRNTRVYRKVQS